MSLQDNFRRVSLDRHLVEVEAHIGDRPVMQREPVEQSIQETVVGLKQEASTRLRSRRREQRRPLVRSRVPQRGSPGVRGSLLVLAAPLPGLESSTSRLGSAEGLADGFHLLIRRLIGYQRIPTKARKIEESMPRTIAIVPAPVAGPI